MRRDRKQSDNRSHQQQAPEENDLKNGSFVSRINRILGSKGKETVLRLELRKAMAEGGCAITEEEEGHSIEKDTQSFQGAGVCKWFNVRMGFGFLSMNSREGEVLEAPVDVFVHQSKLYMEGFRSLKEGEEVEFMFKKSSKGLESVRVTGPGGVHCIGSEKRPKGKNTQKRRSKGDRCYNCGGLDHHAKECKLPPQPKKCHFCQSISHMVANCPVKAQQSSPGSQETPFSCEKGEVEVQNYSPPPTEITN